MAYITKAKFTRGGNAHNIMVNGRRINIHAAKILYRCNECFGEVKVIDNGIKCKANPDHWGFIHRDDVRVVEEKQAENVEQLKQVYEIVDGKVVVNNGNHRTDRSAGPVPHNWGTAERRAKKEQKRAR